jgi:ribosomal protein S18 acetylase RimI-like enzyme
MASIIDLQLARLADADRIADLSRDLIETGLGWSWTPARVRAQIRRRDTVALVARRPPGIAGFGIMHFGRELAHLNLFAVARASQRRGLGTRLLRWLDEAALTAGIAVIQLEVRASNRAGQAFYKASGYEDVARLPGYYQGREAAVRMARFLRMNESLAQVFTRSRDPAPGRV